jgi:mono/diheme cytochrome c family protein
MKKRNIALIVVAVVLLGALFWLFAPPSVGNPAIATDAESIARGAYAYNAAGCGSCHDPEKTGAPIGGYSIEQDITIAGLHMVGTFHAPNITPDPETGIGGWTGRDFLRAVKYGRSPGGSFYWPAFPFRSYKDMTDQDVLDIAAYLMSLEPVVHENTAHELPWYQLRLGMAGWHKLAPGMEGTPAPVGDDPQVQRGAYLARAMGHCGECHTPRNSFGMMQYAQEFAGATDIAPNIDAEGLSSYTFDDFVALLELGLKPDFDAVGGEMESVIDHTSKLTPEDREAYASFFLREQE